MAPAVGGQQTPPGITGWVLTYVQPLKQWFDELVGDPEGVDRIAADWDRSEARLKSMADDLERLQKQLEPLEGRMIRVLDVRYADLHPAARECADWSGAIAAAARYASTVVAAVRNYILDSLYQLERLVGALFGFTLNPFDKVEQLLTLVDVVTNLATAAGRLISDMFDALTRLIELFNSLGPVISHVAGQLREVMSNMLPAAGALAGVATGGMAGAYAGARLGLIFGPLGMGVGAGLGMLLGGTAGGVLGTAAGGVRRDELHDIDDVVRYGDDDMKAEAGDILKAVLAGTISEDELATRLRKLRAWWEAGEIKRLDSLDDFVNTNGLVDRMGGKDTSVFDIKQVRADDGREHWVVTFPSTQEWLDMYGEGGMNDGKNNLPLLLGNGLDSQYERAALKAMEEAGMAPGDPVVFSGFSQGGIAAAKFAANDGHDYRPIGVVANGAPVDHFQVPADIPVISITHKDDIVPWADFNTKGSDRPNFEHVRLPNHDEVPGYDPSVHMKSHNSDSYRNSVQNMPEARAISEEYSWMGGEVIDHQIFHAGQR